MVGVNIPLYDFFAAASSRIPTLQGATHVPTLNGVLCADLVLFIQAPSSPTRSWATSSWLSASPVRPPSPSPFAASRTGLRILTVRCVRASTDRKYDVMQGYEFSYLPCLVLGAKGYVGVSFSLCAPVYHRLDKAFHEGDFATAQRLQLAVSDFLTTVLSYSMIPAVKALAKEVLSTLTYPHLVVFFR